MPVFLFIASSSKWNQVCPPDFGNNGICLGGKLVQGGLKGFSFFLKGNINNVVSSKTILTNVSKYGY